MNKPKAAVFSGLFFTKMLLMIMFFGLAAEH